jgi:hypothetical protein
MLPNPAPYFANLPDPRRETKNKRFVLCKILTIALCAIVSGRDDWKSVARRHFHPISLPRKLKTAAYNPNHLASTLQLRRI